MVRLPRIRFTWRLVRKTTGLALLSALALCLVLLGSIFLRPTRNLWLEKGLDLAGPAVPGQLQGEWTWPHLNRLEGRTVIWTAPGTDGGTPDTLAVINSLVLQLDLPALRDRELRIRELLVDAQLLDLPRIQAQFPPAPLDSTKQGAADSLTRIPFLREGSVAGLPSVGLDLFAFTVERLILPEGVTTQNLAVDGSATMLAEASPGLVLHHLGGRGRSTGNPRWALEIESLGTRVLFNPADRSVTIDSLGLSIPTATFVRDTLEVQAGPLNLAAKGTWNPGNWGLDSDLEFHAAVPVPLQNPLPGMELRRFSGRLLLGVKGTDQQLQLAGSLDLDPSEDLRRGRLAGSLQLQFAPEPEITLARLDTLDLQWRQATLTAAGSWDGQEVWTRARAELKDLELAHLLAPGLLPGVTGKANLALELTGPTANPQLAAEVGGSIEAVSLWDLPGTAQAAAALPPSIPREQFRQAALDLRARLNGNLDRMTVDLQADLGRTSWLDQGLLRGQAQVSPRTRQLTSARLDTLAVALRQTRLTVGGTIDTAGADLQAALSITGPGLLELALPEVLPGADLGLQASLQLGGPWQALSGSSSLAGRIAAEELDIPFFSAAVTGSPEKLKIEARAGGGLRLAAVVLDSLACRWEGHPDPAATLPPGSFDIRAWAPRGQAWLQGSASGDSIRTAVIDTFEFSAAGQTVHSARPFTLRQGPGPGDLALDSLRLAGDLGTVQADGTVQGDRLALAAATDLLLTSEWLDTLFPAPFWSAGEGVDLALDGSVELDTGGDPSNAGPAFTGRSALHLVPRNEEPPARLDVGFRLAGGDTSALLADLLLSIGQTPLVNGSLMWPGQIDRATGRWLHTDDRPGGIQVPEQDLPLVFINRFLPPEVSLEGQLTVGAGLNVTPPEAGASQAAMAASDVTGVARARGLRVNLPNRSRADLEGAVSLEGSLIDPRLTGTVTVTSGLFRLPEIQRALHPVAGTSALWDSARDSEDAAPWLAGQPPEAPVPPFVPDLDLRVLLPGNFRVTGYGLETDLAGEVKVTRGRDDKGRPVPVLHGRINVVEGTLRALNRVFDVEVGEFDLEGRIPVDPRVNLVLVTEIEGTVIRIRVTGTALLPKVDLESEPQMIQADIMAFLLFGRPLNDLDSDQNGSLGAQQTPAQQLRQNLQGLALVFGAAGIQNRMSGRIGVDQVQIGSTTGGEGTLVLGKYLNPRLLLKYHQSLERSGTYFMTLEYNLSRLFKLISTYGQGEEVSGLELRVQKRY